MKRKSPHTEHGKENKDDGEVREIDWPASFGIDWESTQL
jgi:hypothetical protein